MGFLDLFRGKAAPPSTEKAIVGRDVFGPGWLTSSEGGVWVNDDTVMGSVAGAAISVVSEAIASTDVRVRRLLPDGAKVDAPNHPLSRIVGRYPNSFQDSYSFKLALMHRLLRHGEAFFVIVWTGHYRVQELLPIPTPALMTSDGDIFWNVANAHGDPIVGPRLRAAGYGDVVADRDVLRVGAVLTLHYHGLRATSPTAQARGAIGLAAALEKYCSGLFSRGARPGGVLSTSGKLSPEAKARLRGQWQSAFGGVDASSSTAVLEEGLKWEPITLDSVSAQTLEQRRLAVEEVARFYKIPISKLAVSGAVPRSNVEAEQQAFINDCLMPWMERIESAMESKLLYADDEHVIEFDTGNLLRGDMSARAEAASRYRSSGILTINEARRIFEGLPALSEPEADLALCPLPSNVAPGRPPGSAAEAETDPAKSLAGEVGELRAISKRLAGEILRQRDILVDVQKSRIDDADRLAETVKVVGALATMAGGRDEP